MANIVEINDISAPELEVFTKLTEKQLRHKLAVSYTHLRAHET